MPDGLNKNIQTDQRPSNHGLTVIASALFDSFLVSGGWYNPPKISETTGCMTMKFLPNVWWGGTKSEIFLDISWLVCKLQTKIPQNLILRNTDQNPPKNDFKQVLGMLTSPYFAGLSILTSEINPENFRSISLRLAIKAIGAVRGVKKTCHPYIVELIAVVSMLLTECQNSTWFRRYVQFNFLGLDFWK